VQHDEYKELIILRKEKKKSKRQGKEYINLERKKKLN